MEYALDVAQVGAQLCMQKLLLVLLYEDKVQHVGTPQTKHVSTPLRTQIHYEA